MSGNKTKKMESSLAKEGNATGTPKIKTKKKTQKSKAEIEAQVAGQFATKTSKASATVESMARKRDKLTGKIIEAENLNRVEEVKRGRKKGQKNYMKVYDADGKLTGFFNQHGVHFGADEQKALKGAVDSLYRKRKTLANSEYGLLMGYDKNGNLVGELDPIMTFQPSKSMDQFKNREEYYKYYAKLKEFTSKSYASTVANNMKDTYLKVIRSASDISDAEFNEIKKHFEKMSTVEFALRFGSNFFHKLNEFYAQSSRTSPERRQRAFNALTKDMNQKQIDKFLQEQERIMNGNITPDLSNIHAKIGMGKDALSVKELKEKFKQKRKEAKEEAERKKQEEAKKRQEAIDKGYQKYLTKHNLEDTPENLADFLDMFVM